MLTGTALAVPIPSAEARATPATSGVTVYDPPVTIRSDRARRDVRKLSDEGRALRRYLVSYTLRELERLQREVAESGLPESCARLLAVRVERTHDSGKGWAYIDQQLLNKNACMFDASQRVVIKARGAGRGRVVVRLGSGGAPDCAALADARVPKSLVPGC